MIKKSVNMEIYILTMTIAIISLTDSLNTKKLRYILWVEK